MYKLLACHRCVCIRRAPSAASHPPRPRAEGLPCSNESPAVMPLFVRRRLEGSCGGGRGGPNPDLLQQRMVPLPSGSGCHGGTLLLPRGSCHPFPATRVATRSPQVRRSGWRRRPGRGCCEVGRMRRRASGMESALTLAGWTNFDLPLLYLEFVFQDVFSSSTPFTLRSKNTAAFVD